MDGFLNRLKAQAAALDQTIARPRFGIVSSVDSSRATARVLIQPENVLSGWLPVLSPWVGNGWGLMCPPNVGDQVFILAQEGVAEHGVIVGSCFSGVAAPPQGVSPGELWLVHQTGSYLRLRNDGGIEGVATEWVLKGDLRVSGDVYDSHGSLSGLRGHYDAHHHTDSRGGLTSQPDQQD